VRHVGRPIEPTVADRRIGVLPLSERKLELLGDLDCLRTPSRAASRGATLLTADQLPPR